MIGLLDPRLCRGHEAQLHSAMLETYPGQAHLAGFNCPIPGARCETCAHFLKQQRNKKGRCAVYRRLRQSDGPSFPAEAIACRHYEVGAA